MSGEPRSGEPRSSTEPRSAEPRSTEPRGAEPRSAESRGGEPRQKTLTTSDLVASSQRPGSPRVEADQLQDDVVPVLHDEVAPDDRVTPAHDTPASSEETKLAPLFAEDVAGDFRSRWDVVQRGFVDDPKGSVRAGDELVAQVIKSLAETFSGQRAAFEDDQAGHASTENLRLALRRYRSFFERLLSI
jgi:hypothetical protein